ncbi:hypothetical protein EJ08DRAFT_737307 [Tothia fuscella]|uniref:Uncharacterized protein n=1 Tax=Tothia fuscella TaxID=1048955 RepID=A0A9P4TVD5_9PEZI|nr:hypothetical protein EJ08DRAFT_737307 [Tothia fuscella]
MPPKLSIKTNGMMHYSQMNVASGPSTGSNEVDSQHKCDSALEKEEVSADYGVGAAMLRARRGDAQEDAHTSSKIPAASSSFIDSVNRAETASAVLKAELTGDEEHEDLSSQHQFLSDEIINLEKCLDTRTFVLESMRERIGFISAEREALLEGSCISDWYSIMVRRKGCGWLMPVVASIQE